MVGRSVIQTHGQLSPKDSGGLGGEAVLLALQGTHVANVILDMFQNYLSTSSSCSGHFLPWRSTRGLTRGCPMNTGSSRWSLTCSLHIDTLHFRHVFIAKLFFLWAVVPVYIFCQHLLLTKIRCRDVGKGVLDICLLLRALLRSPKHNDKILWVTI